MRERIELMRAGLRAIPDNGASYRRDMEYLLAAYDDLKAKLIKSKRETLAQVDKCMEILGYEMQGIKENDELKEKLSILTNAYSGLMEEFKKVCAARGDLEANLEAENVEIERLHSKTYALDDIIKEQLTELTAEQAVSKILRETLDEILELNALDATINAHCVAREALKKAEELRGGGE